MAKFIEVIPLDRGKEQAKMLINAEKIDYVQQIGILGSLIYLNDIPVTEFMEKPVFKNPLHVKKSIMSIADAIATKEVTDE
ncbi:hypothetical protein [Streptococcus vestibularis]|jgi:hypothetical protein|uniref:hypothetical protein n=1 Tax=Streptococcus vestibularis TaxID=1343 RepID=UPI00204CC18D|nr:MAG TPA: hypothetical protein [Caudoviricetes sp.]